MRNSLVNSQRKLTPAGPLEGLPPYLPQGKENINMSEKGQKSRVPKKLVQTLTEGIMIRMIMVARATVRRKRIGARGTTEKVAGRKAGSERHMFLVNR